MPDLYSYDHAAIRVVPRPERGEFLNAGVILFARTLGILVCRVRLDEERLTALAPPPDFDVEMIRAHLGAVERICAGGEEAGPIGRLSQSQRFHWLVAPRSTVIQVSPVHPGLCRDPLLELDRLFRRLVGAEDGSAAE